MNVDADAFSKRWVRHWNARDVDAVLDDFHDDVVFTSPVAAKLLPETQGVFRGKAALRRYWIAALERIPDLRFTVEGVYQGVNTIVIAYRNQNGDLVRPGMFGNNATSSCLPQLRSSSAVSRTHRAAQPGFTGSKPHTVWPTSGRSPKHESHDPLRGRDFS